MTDFNLQITVEPETKRVLDKVGSNLETIRQLLGENAELLTKTLQSSLEIVKSPLDRPEGISGEAERDAAQA